MQAILSLLLGGSAPKTEAGTNIGSAAEVRAAFDVPARRDRRVYFLTVIVLLLWLLLQSFAGIDNKSVQYPAWRSAATNDDEDEDGDRDQKTFRGELFVDIAIWRC